MSEEPQRPPVDNPIDNSSQDVLDRAPVAREFAAGIRQLDASRGLVVGVLGAWGHGKSSFINLMREGFAQEPALPVIDFNPWMFSGTQQLVDHFFREIASSLRLKDKAKFGKIAGWLDDYGDGISAFAGLAGPWGSGIASLLRGGVRAYRKKTTESVTEKRERIAKELAGLDQPIVVVIDDIDRLTTPEIRDIFQLVRLTASFPSLIYVLAFDRQRVESALDEDGVPGRAYLEKILQLAFDLPAIPETVVTTQVLNQLQGLLDGIDGEPKFDESRWPDIFFEVVRPLIGSMRDVARFTLSASPVVAALGREVEIVDVVAMEAVRIFRPEIFAQLQTMRQALTQPSSIGYGSGKNPNHQAAIDKLLEIAGPDQGIVKHLFGRVFPVAQVYVSNTSYGHDWLANWRRSHRLAHIDFLSMYLDRVAPSELNAFRIAEMLVPQTTDPETMDAALGGLDDGDLVDVFSAMESFEGNYPEDGIVPGVIALLNAIRRVPDDNRNGFLSIPGHLVVTRVVLRMLRQVKDDAERELRVSEILAGVTSYSSKLDFIQTVGHQENVGHALVSQSRATRMEDDFAAEVIGSRPPHPELEWNLARVYAFVSHRSGDAPVLAAERDPNLVRAVLMSGIGYNTSRPLDSRVGKRTAVLAWEGFKQLFGSDANLKEAVDAVRGVDGDTELVQLADKYLTGWRPNRDDD
jgi:hypothetical protein